MSYGQTTEDIRIASGLIKPLSDHTNYHMISGEKRPLKIITRALFIFYKNYISSQDGNHCGFYPSCSVYAAQSINKKGIFIGILAAFDRLSRCNGMSPEKYPLKQGTIFLYDPVD